MEQLTLVAETGRGTGSPGARRLRTEGLIPAVVYGLSKEPVSITVKRGDLRRVLTTDAGLNAVITLEYDGASDLTLVKDLQRHPVRRDVLHVDFLRIDADVRVEVEVPIVLLGEATKVTQGLGVVEQALLTLRVSAKPDSIPNQLELDISEMDTDTTITVADLVLPEGVTTDVELSDPVVTATLTRAAMRAAQEARGEGGEAGDAEGGGEAGGGEAGDAADDSGE